MRYNITQGKKEATLRNPKCPGWIDFSPLFLPSSQETKIIQAKPPLPHPELIPSVPDTLTPTDYRPRPHHLYPLAAMILRELIGMMNFHTNLHRSRWSIGRRP
jgi:hypothetical protein